MLPILEDVILTSQRSRIHVGQPRDSRSPVAGGRPEAEPPMSSKIGTVIHCKKVPADVSLLAWSEVLHVAHLPTLKDREPNADFVSRFPIEFARQHHVLAPRFVPDNTEQQVDRRPSAGEESWQVLDVIGRYLRVFTNPIFVPEAEILRAINAALSATVESVQLANQRYGPGEGVG